MLCEGTWKHQWLSLYTVIIFLTPFVVNRLQTVFRKVFELDVMCSDLPVSLWLCHSVNHKRDNYSIKPFIYLRDLNQESARIC